MGSTLGPPLGAARRNLANPPTAGNSSRVTEQVLLETPDALVRILTLQPGEVGEWHHHSSVEEHIVCLSGRVDVHLTAPTETRVLRSTERTSIPPGRTHRVSSPPACSSTFVLVQGPGPYDFIVNESGVQKIAKSRSLT